MFAFIEQEPKKTMTEQEFVDIVPQLRALALQKALSYPSASDWADDVAQDSLIKMWALRESVSSRQHALGLVATMARHLTIDRLRKEHTVGLEQARNIAATERASERVEEESYGKWLDKALTKLPPTEYQVLHLRQVEKLSAEEIAAIVGISPRSVGTLLSRARKRLLEQIKKGKCL